MEFPGGFAPEEFAAELVEAGFGVDADEFDPGHFGEVFEVFHGEGLAEAGVVGTAGVDPGRGGDFETGFGEPNGAGDGEFGQGGGRA